MQFVRVPSRGSSMWPTVRDGDTLLVDRTAECRVNDLVVVRAGDGAMIAHRLAMSDGCRVRCANARGQLDPWIDCDALLGRVAGIERDGELLQVEGEPRHARVLWALRSGYGLARRAASRLRRSFA